MLQDAKFTAVRTEGPWLRENSVNPKLKSLSKSKFQRGKFIDGEEIDT